ncbi:MAG: class I SAM-dependent methyltransferase [Oscillospiraceae bacterium]|jgi:SAM-dependent methyltransferase|nr:class I SAM-dependent methyltransferase [Oscillospiraceae bacterium]
MDAENCVGEMSQAWDKLYSQSDSEPRYPSDSVVRFVYTKCARGAKVLDLGCGVGRHSWFLAREGFDVCGTDFSNAGIEKTKKLLERENLRGNFKVSSVDNIPYDDNYFDACVSSDVLCCCTNRVIQRSVSELHRVLKPQGKALIVVRADGELRQHIVNEIEHNTFLVDAKRHVGVASGREKVNEIVHYFDEDEVESLFCKFGKLEIDWLERTCDGMKYRDKYILATLEK